MNKNLITKIFLIIFTMGISFAGFDFVFASAEAATAADCHSVNNYSVAGYSNNSTSGTAYTTNNNVIFWYINKQEAISQAADGNTINEGVCIENYLGGGSTAVKTPYKEDLCSNEISSLISSQKKLFEKYALEIGATYSWGFNSHEDVWGLQKLMGEAGCHNNKDCKLGVYTISDFLFCPVCSSINGSRQELDGENSCEDGYAPTEDKLCCEPAECGQSESWWSGKNISSTIFDKTGCCKKTDEGLPDELLGSQFCNGLESCGETPLSGGDCSYKGSGWVEKDGCCVEKCPLPLQSLSGGDCKYLGSGSFIKQSSNGYSCCDKCSGNQKVNSGGTACECGTTQTECEAKDEMLKDCKCVCDPSKQCCGIKLNTVVPFIGDCIEMTTVNDTHDSNNLNTSNVNQLNAFPFLMMGLSKILVTVILIFSFLIVISAGLMMVTGVYDGYEGNYKKGMTRIKNVVVALILLGSSGLILKLINPSFFGG